MNKNVDATKFVNIVAKFHMSYGKIGEDGESIQGGTRGNTQQIYFEQWP